MKGGWFILADAAGGAAVSGGEGAASAAATVPAEGQATGGAARPENPWAGFMMPLLLIAIFYFMFLRPQQRKEKERRKMIEQLRAGTKVVFAGGITGTIKEAREKTFLVESAGGTCLEVLRSSVQSAMEG